MLKYIFTILFLLLNAQLVFAEGASAGFRKKQYISLKVQPIGLGPYIGSYMDQGMTGAGLGLHFGDNTILEFTYKTNSTAEDDRKRYNDYIIYWESLSVSFKQFLGNSFYLSVGGEYRKLSYNYTSYLPNGVLEENTQFSGSSTLATFGLGNQWSWEHMFMGCDWFIMNLPMSNKVNNEYTAGTFSSNINRLNDDKAKYLENFNMSFVQFYLGASF